MEHRPGRDIWWGVVVARVVGGAVETAMVVVGSVLSPKIIVYNESSQYMVLTNTMAVDIHGPVTLLQVIIPDQLCRAGVFIRHT